MIAIHTAILLALALTPDESTVREFRLQAAPWGDTRALIVPGLDDGPLERPVAVFDGGRPIGWFAPERGSDGGLAWRSANPQWRGLAGEFSGYQFGEDIGAECRATWPEGLPFLAHLESIGPGAGSAWIDVGRRQGARANDTWWMRVQGQPVARFDVRCIEETTSFCAIVPLAAEVELIVGDTVELWPDPAERDRGSATSAVAFIEPRDQGQFVWIAAPRGAVTPPDTQVDFERDGVFLGRGVVEQKDSRFWYLRYAPAARAAMPGGAPTDRTRMSEGGEFALAAELSLPPTRANELRIGDNARIRTSADIDARRFAAHVFDMTAAGCLINCGEADGVAIGDVVYIERGQPLAGTLTVTQLQGSYCVARPDPATTVEIGDRVLFSRAVAANESVGFVESVCEDTLLTLQLAPNAAGFERGAIVVIESAGQPIGMCIVVARSADGERAGAIAVAATLARGISPGMQVRQAARDQAIP